MTMAAMAVFAGTGYAMYCVYKDRVVTFTEVAAGLELAIDWILRRDAHDKMVQSEFAAMRSELAEARRQRDEARRQWRDALREQQRRIEQALKSCRYRPFPTTPPRRQEPVWPFPSAIQ